MNSMAAQSNRQQQEDEIREEALKEVYEENYQIC